MQQTGADALTVGLVGAGPWASMFHAPAIAGGPETRLAAVWARRPEAAGELAAAHGAEAVSTFDELLDRCDAVAFAVPPDVQADLAVRAARQGRTLLLDKPIAADVDAAERLADAVDAAGAGSVVLFTMRFNGAIRTFLEQASARTWTTARHRNVGGAFLEGPFSRSPWRHERGAVLDIGPHAFDLLDAACGEITDVDATIGRDGDAGAVTIECRHRHGTRSVAVLSGTATEDHGGGLELSGDGDTMAIDLWAADGHDVHANVRRALVDAAHGAAGPCDVRRGLMVQRLVDRAERQLRS